MKFIWILYHMVHMIWTIYTMMIWSTYNMDHIYHDMVHDTGHMVWG